MKFTDKDMVYSKKDKLSEDEFNSKNVKERITIFLDQDVVDEFRKRAKTGGGKYQSLMNEALREFLFGGRISEIEKRLDILEKTANQSR